jgi:predicted transcriptional regulator
MTTPLTITLPAPLADEVRAAAEARGLTPEDYVRQQLAMDIALGPAADGDDVSEDEAALADFDRTGKGVPWDEVRAWMQSWGMPGELPRPVARKLR